MLLSIYGIVNAQSETELVEICSMISEGATYLKDFKAKLEPNPPAPARFSIVLSKATQYRLSICSSKDYPGEAVLQLYDSNRLLATTHIPATGKDYPFVDFKCQKTGVYHIFITFKDAKPGLAIGMLSFLILTNFFSIWFLQSGLSYTHIDSASVNVTNTSKGKFTIFARTKRHNYSSPFASLCFSC